MFACFPKVISPSSLPSTVQMRLQCSHVLQRKYNCSLYSQNQTYNSSFNNGLCSIATQPLQKPQAQVQQLVPHPPHRQIIVTASSIFFVTNMWIIWKRGELPTALNILPTPETTMQLINYCLEAPGVTLYAGVPEFLIRVGCCCFFFFLFLMLPFVYKEWCRFAVQGSIKRRGGSLCA